MLNNWPKRQLGYINNHENSSTRGSVEQLNAENIFSRYIDVVLPGVQPIHPCAKDSAFVSMCDFSEQYIKFSKVAMCVKILQWISWCFCSWCINEWWGWCESCIHLISSLQNYKLLFFSHTAIDWTWKNMSFVNEFREWLERKSYNTENSCTEIMQYFGFYFRNYIPEIGKLAFRLSHVYILGKIIVQVNDTTCLQVYTISLTENEHVIIQKDIMYLVNKFTHNTSLVVSPFLRRDLRLINLTDWNNPPYLWHNFILIFSDESDQDDSTTATSFCILLQFLLTKNNDSSIIDNHVVSHGWLCKEV